MKWTVTSCSVIPHRLIGSRTMSPPIIHKDAQRGGCIFFLAVVLRHYTTCHSILISTCWGGWTSQCLHAYKILYSTCMYIKMYRCISPRYHWMCWGAIVQAQCSFVNWFIPITCVLSTLIFYRCQWTGTFALACTETAAGMLWLMYPT